MFIKIMFLALKYIGYSLSLCGLILTYKNDDIKRATPCLVVGILLLGLYCLFRPL